MHNEIDNYKTVIKRVIKNKQKVYREVNII